MGILTVLRFYVSDRRAIERMARSRSALWIGLVFVIAAGFAREYDAEYLVREPWHVLLPLPVSLGLSLVLFVLMRLRMGRGPHWPGAWRAYRSFLGLFWMAAPLAFLYAIPYERWLSAPSSVSANLWTLAVVVIWRMVLLVRIAGVLFGMNAAGAFSMVLAVGEVLGLTALAHARLPLINIMGGIRLTESERVIASTTFLFQMLSVLSAPVWGIGALIGIGWPHTWRLAMEGEDECRATRPLKAVALGSLLIWAALLPSPQRQQRLRWEVEQHLRDGRIATGLGVLSAHAQAEFPPHWDPPPRPGYGEDEPPLPQIVDEVLRHPPAPWVRRVYSEKFVQRYVSDHFGIPDDQTWAYVERVLGQLDPSVLEERKGQIEWLRSAREATSRAVTTRPAHEQR